MAIENVNEKNIAAEQAAERNVAAEAAGDKIITTKEGALGWLTFNNPARRNAISREMSIAAAAALEDFSRDDAIRVVILRGAGDKAFISGADISRFEKERSTPEDRAQAEKIRDGARKKLAILEKPAIAMIRGYCIGGGMGWALNCDLRICSDDAKFGIPSAKLGIGYSDKGIRQLMNLVGPAAAKDMLFTGRQFTADEALRMGLVNQVVPVAELESYTRAYAASIAGNAPLSVLSAKTAVNELVKPEAERDMALVKQRALAASNSQDHVEGRRAFMEKRKPVFTGT